MNDEFNLTNDKFNLTQEEFLELSNFLANRFGFAYKKDKKLYVENRLKKILKKYDYPDYKSLYNLLVLLPNNSELLNELVNAMAINESSFFRYPTQMKLLVDKIVPQRITTKKESINKKIRIWHVGVSLGQEAYTSAISILEDKNLHDIDFYILGTDVSMSNIQTACNAVYSETHIKKISNNWLPALIEKYFTKSNDDTYFIKDSLKKKVHFKQHNILFDKCPSSFDVIFCCNVAIYFKPRDKEKMYLQLIKSLQLDGYLFLGHAESIEGQGKAYVETLLEGNTVVYRKISEVKENRLDFNVFNNLREKDGNL